MGDRPPEALSRRDVGETITLDGSVSEDPDGGEVTEYRWEVFRNGQTVDTAWGPSSIDQTITDPGIWRFDLTVVDDEKQEGELEWRETILASGGDRPIPSIATIAPVTVGESVTLDATGSSARATGATLDTYRWHVKQPRNRAEYTGTTATHTFQEPGTALVELEVQDDQGNRAVRTAKVPVADPDDEAPRAWFDPPADFGRALLGETVRLDGTPSTDPNGGEITEYRWEVFRNGGTVRTPWGPSSIEQTISDPGVWRFDLTVVDDEKQEGELEWVDTIPAEGTDRPAPVVDVDGPVAPGESVTLDASSSSARADGASLASYRWEMKRPGRRRTATGQQLTHTFQEAGTALVELKVVDDEGRVAYTTETVAVTDSGGEGPTARIDTPDAMYQGATYTVDGTNSTDPDGGRIQSYRWELYSGGALVESASGPSLTYTFDQSGEWTVKLQVRDDEQDTATATETVQVQPNQQPSAIISAPSSAEPATAVTLSAEDSSDPDGTIESHDWVIERSGSEVNTASGPTVNTEWPETGTYMIQLKVTDDKGATTTATTQLEVVEDYPDPEPSIDVSPESVTEGETITLDGSGSTAPSEDPITSYEWTVEPDPNAGDAPASVTMGGDVVEYEVPKAGYEYLVTLSVTTESGNQASTTARITDVQEPAEPDISIVSSDLTVQGYNGTNEATVTFENTGGKSGSATASTYNRNEYHDPWREFESKTVTVDPGERTTVTLAPGIVPIWSDYDTLWYELRSGGTTLGSATYHPSDPPDFGGGLTEL